MTQSTKLTIIASILIIALFITLFAFFLKPEEDITLPIKVEVYSSFTCPHCKDFFPTVREIDQKFNDDEVELKYYHIDSTGPGYNALIAMLAAKQQNAEWQYTELLFENIMKYNEADLISYAEALELDIQKFNSDRTDNSDVLSEAQSYLNSGNERGIAYTPTLIINDRIVSERDKDKLIELIQDKINKAQKDG